MTGSPEVSGHQAQTLYAVSRALLPHRNAPDQPYVEVVTALKKAAAESGKIEQLIETAVDELDAAANGNWLAASPERKVEILEARQDAPYFGVLLNTAIDTIYRHPAIWNLVGYEGSSMEHGGYLYRGFDDIDWLPPRSGKVAE